MFQINRVDMITKTFRFPEDMLKELEILAQKNNISVNKLVSFSAAATHWIIVNLKMTAI